MDAALRARIVEAVVRWAIIEHSGKWFMAEEAALALGFHPTDVWAVLDDCANAGDEVEERRIHDDGTMYRIRFTEKDIMPGEPT